MQAKTTDCKICHRPLTAIHDTQMLSDFYHCPDCAFIFKDHEAYVSSERERKQYDQHNNTLESPGYVQMFEAFIALCITPHAQEIQTVLEFGSGPGPVLSKLLRDRGLEVDSYDKFYAPTPVYEGKQYDLITATEVIEHIEGPLEIMRFFHEHLRKGGYLALMTQFHSNDSDTYLRWWYRRDPTHISFFTPETFRTLAKKSGFDLLLTDEKKSILLQKR